MTDTGQMKDSDDLKENRQKKKKMVTLKVIF